jgi:PhnB protein
MAVKPVPPGFHTVTPYLTVADAAGLLEFIKKAFDATEHYVMRGPAGEVRHGDVIVGDSHIMLGEAGGQWMPTPAQLYLYVPDCDAVYRQGLDAGATAVQEPKTQFYGDRHGCVKDAWGNLWWAASHVEDVSEKEIAERAKTAMSQ